MQEQLKTLHRDGFASLHGGLLARKGMAQPAVADLDEQRRARRGDRDGEEPKPREATNVKPPTLNEKPRVSLRLTQRQLRLLRLVAAATDRSQQEILSMAVDQHLTRVIGEELGHCRCLRRLVLGDDVKGCGKLEKAPAA